MKILNFVVFTLGAFSFLAPNLSAQTTDNPRRAINLGTQDAAEYFSGPSKSSKVIVHSSGSNDGAYFVIPSAHIETAPLDLLFETGECKADPNSSNIVTAKLNVIPGSSDFDMNFIEKQIEEDTGQKPTSIAMIPFTILKGTLSPDDPDPIQVQFSRPIDLTGRTFEQALSKIQPRPFKSDEKIGLKYKASCKYWNKFRQPQAGADTDLSIEFTVPVNAYLSSTTAYSVTSFMNSNEAQKIFSDQAAEGQLRFEQDSSSKAGGILKGLLGSNKVKTSVGGGIVDTRKRWISTDSLRDYVGQFMANAAFTQISDGLAFQDLAQDIVEQFINDAVEETRNVALTPDFADRDTLTFADDAVFSAESYAALAKSIAEAAATASSKFSFEDCQEFVETIIASSAGGPAGATLEAGADAATKEKASKEQSPETKKKAKEDKPSDKKTEKEDTAKPKAVAVDSSKATGKTTTETPQKEKGESSSDVGDCTHKSFADSKSGLTLKFDGSQKTWVPTKLSLHLVSQTSFRKALTAEFKRLKLTPIVEENWMEMPNSARQPDGIGERLAAVEAKVKLINQGRMRAVSSSKINSLIKNEFEHAIFVTVSQNTPNNGAAKSGGKSIKGNSTNSCDVSLAVNGMEVARSRINNHSFDKICTVSAMVPPKGNYIVRARPYLADKKSYDQTGSLIRAWYEFY